MSRKFTAIDIGSSKISCLVARHTFDKGLKVIAHSSTQSSGISKGVIRNISALEKSILVALGTIETQLRDSISKVSINVSGPDVEYVVAEVSIALSEKPVSKKDLNKLISMIGVQEPNTKVLHIIPISYKIDDLDGIKDPLGMVGGCLTLKATVIYTSKSLYKNLILAFERCNVKVIKVVAGPYALGLGVLTEEEAKIGTALVDIGATITTIAYFKDSTILFLKSIPVGGVNITKDIAYAFNIDFNSAERLKILYGSATRYTSNAKEFVLVPSKDDNNLVNLKQVQKSEIFSIIEPRVREILGLVSNEFKHIHPNNIVCTGGTSALNGIINLAEETFKVNVRYCRPSEEYSPSVVGIINSVYNESPSSEVKGKTNKSTEKDTVLKKVVNWIVENF